MILATVDFILVLRYIFPYAPTIHGALHSSTHRVWILYGKNRMLLYLLVPMIGCKLAHL